MSNIQSFPFLCTLFRRSLDSEIPLGQPYALPPVQGLHNLRHLRHNGEQQQLPHCRQHTPVNDSQIFNLFI